MSADTGDVIGVVCSVVIFLSLLATLIVDIQAKRIKRRIGMPEEE